MILPRAGCMSAILIAGTFLLGSHFSRAIGDISMDVRKLTLEEIVARLRQLADEIRAQAQAEIGTKAA